MLSIQNKMQAFVECCNCINLDLESTVQEATIENASGAQRPNLIMHKATNLYSYPSNPAIICIFKKQQRTTKSIA